MLPLCYLLFGCESFTVSVDLSVTSLSFTGKKNHILVKRGRGGLVELKKDDVHCVHCCFSHNISLELLRSISVYEQWIKGLLVT